MERIGHYQVERLLGEGGMARVYRAVDDRLGRPVAVKVLKEQIASSPKAADRFHREARLAASLRHPNVVTVHDCSDPGDEQLFLVTELVDGGDLRQEMERRGRLLPEEAALLLLPVARALGAAHALGIVHRDVKPDNILLDRGAGAVTIKLADFGVAVCHDEPRITTDGGLSGSVAYMAPEQLQDGEASAASDVWSVGVMLWELVAGEPPSGAGTVGQAVARILAFEPGDPPLPELWSEELSDVLRRTLAPDRAERLENGGELARALERALAAAGLKSPDTELQRWHDEPGHRDGLRRRLADALVDRASSLTAVTERAELLDRALALVPDHPGALELLGGRPRSAPATRPRSWTLLVALLGVVSVAAGLWWWLSPTPGPAPAEPAPAPAPTKPRVAVTGSPDVGVLLEPDAAPTQPDAGARTVQRTKKKTARPRAPGIVHLTTEPWAEVVVDGRSLGFTPKLRRFELAAGAHRVELRNPMCRPRRLRLRVSPGETILRHVRLDVLPARLRVRAPRGWTIIVDGSKVGVAPLAGPLNLSHGSHEVTAVAPSGERASREVKLTAGKTVTLDLKF
jgi:serine/threonine-protein kinase